MFATACILSRNSCFIFTREKMKIVKFLGGLGNQMFQYAFYMYLKQHFRKVKADLTGFTSYPLHNGFELDQVFGIRLRQASPFEIRLYTPERKDWATRKLRRLYGTKKAWYAEKKRSEEHTSDLQSLMRTSYAVTCMK